MNQNSSNQQQFALFKKEQKSLMITFYVFGVLQIIFLVLGIVSSVKLQSDYSYYNTIQTLAVVGCSFANSMVLVCFYIISSHKFTRYVKIFTQVCFFVFATAAMGMMFASQIIPIVSNYCGYYIEHSGYVDGSFIISSLQANKIYPSCSAMENNPQYSLRDQLISYSATVIIDYCQGDLSCQNLGSLLVEKWSEMFSFQLAALIGCVVMYILFCAVMSLFNIRQKNFQDQISKRGLIKNAS